VWCVMCGIECRVVCGTESWCVSAVCVRERGSWCVVCHVEWWVVCNTESWCVPYDMWYSVWRVSVVCVCVRERKMVCGVCCVV